MQPEFNRNLSKDDINQLPIFRYEGPVKLVEDQAGLDAALDELRTETLLGFDTETKPSFRKGTCHKPALIQLAGTNAVYLFQLRKLPLGAELAALLSNPAIIKAGVAIRDDMRFLTQLYDFKAAGLVDLADLARKNNLRVYGLRPLAADLLQVRVSKSARCSNWNNNTLSQQQVCYAATDAWISRQLYLRLGELGLNLQP